MLINATDYQGKTALSLAVAGVKKPLRYADREGLRAVVQLLNNRCGVQVRGSDTAPAAGSLTEDVPSHS